MKIRSEPMIVGAVFITAVSVIIISVTSGNNYEKELVYEKERYAQLESEYNKLKEYSKKLSESVRIEISKPDGTKIKVEKNKQVTEANKETEQAKTVFIEKEKIVEKEVVKNSLSRGFISGTYTSEKAVKFAAGVRIFRTPLYLIGETSYPLSFGIGVGVDIP